MTAWSQPEIRQTLLSKGFCEVSSGDHINFYLVVGGKKTSVRTWISHSRRTEVSVSSKIFKGMKRQLHLTTQQLKDLLECPLGHGDLVKLLTEQNVIRAEH